MIVLKSYATWIFLALVIGVIGSHELLGDDLFMEIARVVMITACINAIVLYLSTFLGCFVTPGWPRWEQWGGFSVVVLAFGLLLQGLLTLFYRLSGQQDWILRHPSVNSYVVGAIFFLFIFQAGPRFFESRLPMWKKRLIAGLWFVTVLVAIFIGLARPDLRDFASSIKPYFDDGRGRPPVAGRCEYQRD